MEKDLSAAIDKLRNIQEEIKRLMPKTYNIIMENLGETKTILNQHTQASTAIRNYMEDILCDLEEKKLTNEISSFCQKYPKIKLSKEVKEEMICQGFSINEAPKFLVIIGTPYADYSFNKKTGRLLGKSA